MVDEQGTGRGLVIVGVEGAAAVGVAGEDVGGVAVEVADFADDGAYEFGCVGGEVGELLGAFGLLDLWGTVVLVEGGERGGEVGEGTDELVA